MLHWLIWNYQDYKQNVVKTWQFPIMVFKHEMIDEDIPDALDDLFDEGIQPEQNKQ